MGGVLVHLCAGLLISIVAILYYRKYFEKNEELLFILPFIAVWFSVFPDVFLGLYYILGISTFPVAVGIHMMAHTIFFVVSLVAVILLKFRIDIPNEPLFVIVFVSMVVHIIMDFFVPEMGIWI